MCRAEPEKLKEPPLQGSGPTVVLGQAAQTKFQEENGESSELGGESLNGHPGHHLAPCDPSQLTRLLDPHGRCSV